tara:strand:- start:1036 stop:2046 length:1011 start_codon:yes stop_codon:yes gene_type:complete
MSNLKNILTSKISCKSVWFMRQAGRYLPEFRKIRSQNSNFIKLCLNSELSSQITLQPINRFNLDSAIIFSDILMVPHALGQEVNFVKDQGPKLNKFNTNTFLNNTNKDFSKKLSPIYQSIEIVRKKLHKKKSLISFVGAPWTLLVYMLNARTSKNEIDIEKIDNINPNLDEILETLIKYLCLHIKNQINAGADVVQIFDSWAGFIPEKYIRAYCFEPNLKIVDFCKKNGIPNICFPKGIKKKYEDFNKFVKPDGLNIDFEIEPDWAREKLTNVVLQGGLHPNVLLKNKNEIYEEATKYIKAFKDIPYVFNLGHGLLPQTDPDNVEQLVNFYRNFNG